jgi:putative colanic acid biosynthesis acetyltransferase WcaF
MWRLVQSTLFRWSFHNWYGYRRRLLAWFGARLDPTVWVRRTVRIDRPWNLSMGRKSSLGDACVISAPAPVTIGARTVCSQYTHISSWVVEVEAGAPRIVERPIEIGDDVWIATECVVTAGSRIENGALIGARSVVRDAVSPWMIHAGIPARSVRPRPYAGDRPSRSPSSPIADGS